MKWIFLVFLMFNFFFVRAQPFSRSSIKFGTCIGMAVGTNYGGMGITFIVGYQKEIWKDRLRINPNFSFGYFNSKLIQDGGQEWINSFTMQTNIYFDVIKDRSFSIMAGTGLLLNYSTGLLGTGGYHSTSNSSEYVYEFHGGLHFGAGFRINPPARRYAFEIVPFNFNTDFMEYLELYPRFSFDIKL